LGRLGSLSETESTAAPRDDTSGQFTAEKFGIEGVEAEQGYTHVKAPAAPPADDSPEAVYDEYKRKRGADNGQPTVRELTYAETGEKVEDNLAITAEQAHAALTQSYSFEHAARELLGIEQLQKQVDADRAEVIKGDAKIAKELGVEIPAEDGSPIAEPTQDEIAAAKEQGLTVETVRALKNPEIRAAVEQEFSRAETVRAEYSQGLQAAHDFGQAAFMSIVPELQGLPPDQIEQGLQILAQVEPQRYQAAMETLQRVGALQQARAQQEQQRAYVERQQIETWAKAEDARLKTMGIEITNEIANEVADYAKSLGIERAALGKAMLDHPILRSAEVQAMMVAAAKYHAIQKAPAKAAPKHVPSVQRPGVARSAGDRDASEIMSLRQKATKSGSPEDAFALYKARKARR
jgi:hypothetical protein